ncbi:hypothetical protein RJ639_018080 [Escallonia herrerae]|uniref:peroxidase n=1 Tax=Escallonia herrerae TaxID=1293975 RepID=A0AA89AID1_9ASTE|nr:hypothetical protein RJ639_018080 [Escallonia herrerae]
MIASSILEGLAGMSNLTEVMLGQQARVLPIAAFLLQLLTSMPSFPDSLLLAFPPKTWLPNLVILLESTESVGLFDILTGSHSIGQARCTSFRARIYNETNLESLFAQTRRSNCPRTAGSGDNNLSPLDLQTPTAFDNNYYKNLVNQRGLLHSDQQLFNGGSTDSIVRTYSNSYSNFVSDFTAAMIRMGDIGALTGSSGEIRKNCRKTN